MRRFSIWKRCANLLNQIRAALEEFGKPVFYGSADNSINDKPWNFYVFSRKDITPSGKSSLDYTQHYEVAIIRENYIPEGHEWEVIKAVTEATGCRLTKQPFLYAYTRKNDTDLVIEMLVIEFSKAVKGCDV